MAGDLMAGKSNIEWTGHTWNPLAGCSVLTPGCKRCYAMKMAARLEAMGQDLYKGLTEPSKAGPVWTGVMRQAPEHVLLAPLKRKKPTVYFVNSMSDLFHENVPDAWIDRVFAVMALAPQHTFQVLTKRAGRMRDYFLKDVERGGMINCSRADRIGDVMMIHHKINSGFKCVSWPLPNVWLGVSTERQQEADERIPHLLNTPAAVRFISAEPLLGPIDLRWIAEPDEDADGVIDAVGGFNWIEGPGPFAPYIPARPGHTDRVMSRQIIKERSSRLDWVIVGGESGPGARPMHPQWARDIRDQCSAAGVEFFFKQYGSWAPCDAINVSRDHALCGLMAGAPHIERDWTKALDFFQKTKGVVGADVLAHVGKKAGGRLLDGIEHNGFPGARA